MKYFVAVILILIYFGSAQAQEPILSPQNLEQLENQPWWWMAKQRAYPLTINDAVAKGVIEDAVRKATEQVREKGLTASQLQPLLLGQQSSTWESIGPAHYDSDFYFFAQENSARIVSSAVDPGNPDHWLIGAQNGGLWQTRDAGLTWTPRIDDLAPLGMWGSIAFAPGDPNIVYTVTRAGLLKSLDGGDSWNIFNTDIPFDGESATVLVVSPANSDIVIAAIDERFTFFPSSKRGVYKTTNGGLTWTRKLELTATDLVVDPEYFLRQYTAVGHVGTAQPAVGLHRSTDAGETWSSVAGPWDGSSARIKLAIAPTDSNVLYVLVESLEYSKLLGVWKTTNAWDQTPDWIQLPKPGNEGYGHGAPLTVDPDNADVLYFGSLSLWRFDGTSWADVADFSAAAQGRSGGLHVDFYSLTWLDSILIATNDGGIFSSPTGTPPWSSHNTDLRINEFYWGIGLQPYSSDFALIGGQDTGTLIYNGSAAWDAIAATGDGMANVVSITSPQTDWLVSGFFMNMSRTLDGGATFDGNVTNGIDRYGTSFFTEFLRCPNSDLIIAGTDNLWRTEDMFTNTVPFWTKNGPEIGSTINALAFAPTDFSCQTYAFGAGNSQLRATQDGGTTWVDIDLLDEVPDRFITDLAFDPDDANTIYVTLSGIGSGHLYRGTGIFSGSPRWSDVSPPVDVPHNTLAIDPTNSANIYAGTDLGLWVTSNGGSQWTQVSYTEVPHVTVTDMEFNDRGLFLSTYGRGAYRLSGPVEVTIVPDVVGETLALAVDILAAANLFVDAIVPPEFIFSDIVVAQSPAGGSELSSGRSVDLTILTSTQFPENINELVSFEPDASSFPTTSNAICGGPYVDELNFQAPLRNINSSPISSLIEEVERLTPPNLIVMPGLESVAGGESFPFQEEVLNPGETLQVPFTVCFESLIGDL